MIKNEQERQRIGQDIAQLRKEKGMTQQDLSEAAGIGQGHLSRIEAGKYCLGVDTLARIVCAMGYRIDFVKDE